MEGKYKFSYIKDNFQNLSLKELNRFHFLQKLKSFYVHKAIKDGKLISESDARDHIDKLIEFTVEKYKNNLTSETQLEKLSLKNKEQLTKIVNRQLLASLLEIAYLNLEKEFKMSTKAFQVLFEQELNKEIENLINIKLNTDEDIAKYRKKIIELSGREEDTLRVVIDEIKYPCEFQKVIVFMVVCDSVSELPKRDRKQLYEEKRKFERKKRKIINDLKELNIPYSEVQKRPFISPEALGWHNYETTIKHYKSILFFVLIDHCKTGIKRAKEIVKILDYL